MFAAQMNNRIFVFRKKQIVSWLLPNSCQGTRLPFVFIPINIQRGHAVTHVARSQTRRILQVGFRFNFPSSGMGCFKQKN